jgi:hypothetical protein
VPTPPVLNTGLNWQLYSWPGFTGKVDIARDVWFHLRLVVAGAQALPRPGSNELVLAVSELGGGWGFICRLAAADN